MSGICKVWEKVFHTPASIEEAHNNGVDRTTLTLSTGGNDQDVQAILELYGNFIDPLEPQTGQETTLGKAKTTHKDPQSDQKGDHRKGAGPQKADNEPQNTIMESSEPQNGSQKLLETVRLNPKITKAVLSEMLGVSNSTLKRWLKANNIVWVGHSKNGRWEILM